MKKIAFDVMGNDNGVSAAVIAVNNFISDNKDFFFYLVGDQKKINQHLTKSKNIEVIHTKKEINPRNGLKKNITDKDTSMAIAVNLVKQKKADIVISSGDSGIYLAMTMFNLGKLNWIKRPAFMLFLPTLIPNKKTLILDVGANLNVTGEMLVQWAKIGQIFFKHFFKVKKPKIAVINVGHENYKGQDFHSKAYQMLSTDKKNNFKGYIEPKKILNGEIDVIVTDGYAGNMILKTIEGTFESLFFIIKRIIKSKFRYKIAALILSPGIKKNIKKMDYRNTGASWIVGLKGLAIKCHGSADVKSYLGAFNQVKIGLENKIAKTIKYE